MTHGHELWWGECGREGVGGWSGVKGGGTGTPVIAYSIKYIKTILKITKNKTTMRYHSHQSEGLL